MAPKRTFGKSTLSGPTATPQSNAPSGNGHRYDAAEKIWDGDPMTMSLWFVQVQSRNYVLRSLVFDSKTSVSLVFGSVEQPSITPRLP